MPHNQGIKKQVNTKKKLKKEDRLYMKPPKPWNMCARVFKIQLSIDGVNCSNISILQVRVNMTETEHDTNFETS